MTPARQPHHQRCETCSHWKKRRPESTIKTCEILNAEKMSVIPIGESEIMALVGCATHTSPPAPDEMEIRFRTKREAWEQGYQDGSSSVQHDLNLLEQAAAKAAREKVLDVITELKQREGEYTVKMMNTNRENLQSEFWGRAKAYADAWILLEESLRTQQENGR